MRLTTRDKLIIDALQKQDFCFYTDIKRHFFSSHSSACNRLTKLKRHGYIQIEPLKYFNLKKNLDKFSTKLIGRNLKVISLSDKCSLIKTSSWKRTHQLLLFSIKERLENLLETEAVFENQIRDLKNTLYNGNYEPLPDFYLKKDGFKLAVELELNLKSQNRYFLKMSEYRRSRFTHVLYVSSHMKKMQKLIRTFRYKKYIAISHYSKIEEVTSHRYGKLPLLEWLGKKTK